MPQPLPQAVDQVEDLGLDRDVQRGGRLVGDQQLRLAGQRHGDHHPLAHAAGELVRVVVEPLRGPRDADQPQHLDRARSSRLCGDALVLPNGLGDLPADGHGRVAARSSDPGRPSPIVAAANVAHARVRQAGQVGRPAGPGRR